MSAEVRVEHAAPTLKYASLTPWLYRHSGYAFLVLTACAVLAFWPGYLVNPAGKDFRLHIHAAALGGWCALLIGQAFLIRAGRRATHRRVGRLSYVVGPAVTISILVLNHHRAQTGVLNDFRLWLFTSNVGDAVLFFVCWALAMANVNKPAVHARFMVCTAITFVPPVFDRLVSRYALTPQLKALLPTVGGQPFAILPSFVMVFVTLAVLAWWDWQSARRSTVFVTMLAVFALFYLAPVLLLMFPLWRQVVFWHLKLPLS